MKETILAALKTKYSNLGFGPKTLDGVADYLAKAVSDDSQIETAITGVEPLLKIFQADADRTRTENNALKTELEELKGKASGSPAKGGEQGKNTEPDVQKMIEDAIAAKLNPLQAELSSYKEKAAKNARSAMISRIVKELGISESRAEEGFAISDDMDEAGVKAYLTKIRENEIARGLPRTGGFPLSGGGEATKEETDAIAAKMFQ